MKKIKKKFVQLTECIKRLTYPGLWAGEKVAYRFDDEDTGAKVELLFDIYQDSTLTSIVYKDDVTDTHVMFDIPKSVLARIEKDIFRFGATRQKLVISELAECTGDTFRFKDGWRREVEDKDSWYSSFKDENQNFTIWMAPCASRIW